MTKSQKFLIGAVLTLFALVIFLFRGDWFIIPNRPGVTSLLQNVVQPYGLVALFLLFGYLLSKGFGFKGWVFVLFLCLVELAFYVILHFGYRFLPDEVKLKPWFQPVKGVAGEIRSMIQFQDETATYDKELFYTLKPGESRFKSYEFDTEIKVNNLGVRDTEENFKDPEVVFLGDSFTMGWGVENEESYARVFADGTGLKVLNTGISSYGTAREYRMLDRIGVDSLKLIIIQYHDTDLEENNFYLKNGRLGSRTQADFDSQVADNKKNRSYFPFQYLKTYLLNRVKNIKMGQQVEPAVKGWGGVFAKFPEFTPEFFEIVAKIQEIKDVPVLVTFIGSFYTDPNVIKEFEKYATDNGIKNVHFLNMGDKLDHKNYFFLDDHINASGHKIVGGELVKKAKTIL